MKSWVSFAATLVTPSPSPVEGVLVIAGETVGRSTAGGL